MPVPGAQDSCTDCPSGCGPRLANAGTGRAKSARSAGALTTRAHGHFVTVWDVELPVGRPMPR